MIETDQIEVIAPNLKRRHSGVTSTILRLVPLQARDIGIRATGFGLPPQIPQIPLRALLSLPRTRPIVWHARRNTEMLAGLALRRIMGRQIRLLFTSAAQRHHSRYTKSLIARMDHVIATCDAAARYLDRPATVIRHGIDTALFHPATDKTALRARLGLPEGVLIGCYGRIRHQKGQDLFLEALARTLPHHPNAHGIIMGRTLPKDAAYRDALMTRAQQAGIAERVHLLDEQPMAELPDRFAALDIYVAPQRWEGFGLTPLEAMASGVPVIATRAGAFEELVADGETGRICDIEDTVALSKALEELLDPVRRAAWGQQARLRTDGLFRLESEAKSINKIYRQLLDSKPE